MHSFNIGVDVSYILSLLKFGFNILIMLKTFTMILKYVRFMIKKKITVIKKYCFSLPYLFNIYIYNMLESSFI